jgi:quercetin dioxygenase-like cupin family protein
MRRIAIPLLLLVAVLVAAQTPSKKSSPAKKAPAAETKHAFTPDDVQYGPPPPFIPPGAQVAVLEGNPMGTTGDYTIRVKTPDGYVVPPHFHPKRENVTVISGTLNVGVGDKFDEGSMKPFAAGSFAYLDPSMHHYVKAQGETIIQIHGQAPLAFTYINKSDDPRNKK